MKLSDILNALAGDANCTTPTNKREQKILEMTNTACAEGALSSELMLWTQQMLEKKKIPLDNDAVCVILAEALLMLTRTDPGFEKRLAALAEEEVQTAMNQKLN